MYTHTYNTYTYTDICFCIIKIQDFKQVLHKLHGQSLQTHCLSVSRPHLTVIFLSVTNS